MCWGASRAELEVPGIFDNGIEQIMEGSEHGCCLVGKENTMTKLGNSVVFTTCLVIWSSVAHNLVHVTLWVHAIGMYSLAFCRQYSGWSDLSI